jgi:predicted ATPase/DNA-binding SARP family transcriptional activator
MANQLALRLLGAVEIVLGGTLIETDRRKAVALLVYLALTGQPHSREALATLFWPDHEPAKAFAYLRRTLWEINQALGEGWLDADREAIGIRPDAQVWVDVAQFQALLAKRAAPASDAQTLARLHEAVALYRGEFLSGLALRDSPGFDEWQRSLAENLRGQYSEALQALTQAGATQGDYETALTHARRWLALDTLNEAAHRQVMELLTLSGQRHAAIRQYESCARILKAELDIAPEAATTALYEKIKAEGVAAPAPQPASEADTPEIIRALRSGRLAPKHNLPAQLTSFIGRQKEIADIKQRLWLSPLPRSAGEGTGTVYASLGGGGAKPRLITLTGSGGTGKTRLSLQVAAEVVPEFPDGVYFVEFAPLTDPALAPQAVLTALKLREEREHPALTVLADYAREKTLLLIFDNCEHLIDACARLAEALLRAAPNLWILATSREALGIPGEVTVRIPSLSLPEAQTTQRTALLQSEAGRLFLERAQTALPDFDVTDDNAPAIARVCRRLDGIPLALELAAARVKTLRVEQIAARLDDRFRLLTGGSRTALPRQQTLRALIDWSYNLLAEPERALLQRFSVFAGGWTLEAAEAVCREADLDVLDGLTQLVNKSLVVAERQPGADARYFLLETIRQYAREKLLDTEEGDRLRQRHLQFFVRLGEALEPEMHGPGLIAALNRLEAEHDNLRAALEWAIAMGADAGADAVAGLRLGGAVWGFWNNRSYLSEGREWLGKILALPAAQAHTLPRAKALNGLAFLTYLQLGSEASLTLHEESLSLWRELSEPCQVGYLHALRLCGDVTYDTRDKARGHALIEESLALAKACGDKIEIAWSLFNLGMLAQREGRMEAARAIFAESLALHRQAQLPNGVAHLLNAMGWHALIQEDLAASQPLVEESLRLFHVLGDKFGLANALNIVGNSEWMRGHHDRALLYFTECLELAREIRAPGQMANATYHLGWLNYHLGNRPQARRYFLQALSLVRQNNWPEAMAYGLAGFASSEEAEGRWARAVQLLSTAEVQRAALDFEWDTLFRNEIKNLQDALRRHLDEAAWAEAWATGEKMKLEAAVAYALQEGAQT